MKYLITLSLLLLLTTTTWSQDTWVKTFGGTMDDVGNSITTTSDGGVAITGYTKSNDLDFQGMNKGGENIVVIKLDKGGNVLWKYLIEGPERGQSITNTSDGGVVITGVRQTTSRESTVWTSGTDILAIKLDNDGNVQWKETLVTNWGNCRSMSNTSDGGILITGDTYSNGWTYSNDGVFRDGESYLKGMNIFVIKLDKDVNIQWKKVFGGTSEDIGESLTTTPDGGILITGSTYSNDGDFKWMKKDRKDIFVIKLDKDGKVLWKKSFGGSGDELGQSITTTSDGRILITGWTNSHDGDFEGKRKYSTDIFVMNLDKDGKVLWKKTYGGIGTEEGNSITTTSDGGILFTGWTNSFDGDFEGMNKGKSDIFVIKLDKDGNIQWKKTYGGKEGEEGNSITTTLDGGILITGSTSSNDGDFKGMNKGGELEYRYIEGSYRLVRKEVSTDVFVMKLDEYGNLKPQGKKSKKK